MNAHDETGDDVVQAAESALRARLAEIRARHHLPGLSAGIVRDGRLVWSVGLGYADVASGRHPDARTLYRVASITKTFTAAAIVQLRDAGLLGLDDPLVRHLPEFAAVRSPHAPIEALTLRRLLTHLSGLMSEGPFPYWDSMQFPTMAEILAALPRSEIVLPPNAGAKYSNLAFALLGEVIARRCGSTYEAYVQERILAPLGMTSSTFTPEGDLAERLAVGYSPHPYEDTPEPAGHTPTRGITAAAGLYTTVEDLARWLALQFEAAPPSVGADADPTLDESQTDAQVLAPRSLDEMHLPQAIDAGWNEARCLGWAALRRGERVYVGHGGSIHGFITQVRFSKMHRTGAIVLTNQGRHTGADEACTALLDLVLDEADRRGPERDDRPPLPTPAEWRRLLGRYSTWGAASVLVECRDGVLRLAPAPPDSTGLHAPARLAATEDPLVFRVLNGRGAGECASFTASADGTITGFTLSGFRYLRQS